MPEIEEPTSPITLVGVRSKATTYPTMRDALAALVRATDAYPQALVGYCAAHAVELSEGGWCARVLNSTGYVWYVSEDYVTAGT